MSKALLWNITPPYVMYIERKKQKRFPKYIKFIQLLKEHLFSLFFFFLVGRGTGTKMKGMANGCKNPTLFLLSSNKSIDEEIDKREQTLYKWKHKNSTRKAQQY